MVANELRSYQLEKGIYDLQSWRKNKSKREGENKLTRITQQREEEKKLLQNTPVIISDDSVRTLKKEEDNSKNQQPINYIDAQE